MSLGAIWRQCQPLETRFAVPIAALDDWRARLASAEVDVEQASTATGAPLFRFRDPDGLPLALLGQEDEGIGRSADAWQAPGIEPGMAIWGFAGMTLSSHRPEATARVLTELLGYTEAQSDDEGRVFHSGYSGPGDQLHLLHDVAPGQPGYGTVHHVAFRVPDRPGWAVQFQRFVRS